jgi:hypothetical protein
VLTAKTLTTAEQARLDQRVHTVIQKRGLDRETLFRNCAACSSPTVGRRSHNLTPPLPAVSKTSYPWHGTA